MDGDKVNGGGVASAAREIIDVLVVELPSKIELSFSPVEITGAGGISTRSLNGRTTTRTGLELRSGRSSFFTIGDTSSSSSSSKISAFSKRVLLFTGTGEN